LLELHSVFGGPGPGRRVDIEVLNKSAIVLLTACWESFVEDTASSAFEILLGRAPDHSVIPTKVLTEASRVLKSDDDDRAVWRLAGTGWRRVLLDHKETVCGRYLRNFHTPRTAQVDQLLERLLGLSRLSIHWRWPRVTSEKAIARLEGLVDLRGEIAHRVTTNRRIHKRQVLAAGRLIARLVIATHVTVASHLEVLLGVRPWPAWSASTS
jgi:hypothetical protein